MSRNERQRTVFCVCVCYILPADNTSNVYIASPAIGREPDARIFTAVIYEFSREMDMGHFFFTKPNPTHRIDTRTHPIQPLK